MNCPNPHNNPKHHFGSPKNPKPHTHPYANETHVGECVVRGLTGGQVGGRWVATTLFHACDGGDVEGTNSGGAKECSRGDVGPTRDQT